VHLQLLELMSRSSKLSGKERRVKMLLAAIPEAMIHKVSC